MAKAVSVKVDGLEDLEKKLDNLPSKFAKSAVRKALGPAANIWKEAFANNAPEKTGWLRSQAAMSIRLSARQEEGTALVGFTTKQNPNGTEKHPPSAANEAFWYETGTLHQPARPFMRPAFESLKSLVLDTFVAKLKETFAEVFGK